MPKLSSLPALASLPALFAAGVLSTMVALPAQRAPLPGLPMVPPPAPHPGLLAQPLTDDGTPTATPAAPAGGGAMRPQPDPATQGVKAAGKDLKKAVAKVKQLDWHKRIDDAKAEAERTGKPILWLSTLGDLTGFA